MSGKFVIIKATLWKIETLEQIKRKQNNLSF